MSPLDRNNPLPILDARTGETSCCDHRDAGVDTSCGCGRKSNAGAEANDSSWWRSLEELAGTEVFREQLHREFPDDATSLSETSRREFLRLMGASLLLASAAGCEINQPPENIVPSARLAGHAKPGLPVYFTTAFDFAGSATGLTVQCRDGRPVKIEGNSAHPSSLGATNVFAQAATLDLYDPDRLRVATTQGKVATRERVLSEFAALRARMDEDKGAGTRLLIGSSTSPTLKRLLDSMTSRWPEFRWAVYEPVNEDSFRQAAGDAASSQLVYDFSKAQVVLSVDADFLAARDYAPCYIRQFANARRIFGAEEPARQVRLYHLGSTPSLTSAKADHSLPVPPGEIPRVLRKVLNAIEGGEAVSGDPFVEYVIDDLRTAGSNSLIVAGRQQSPEVHALVMAINDQLGALGNTVAVIPSSQVRPDATSGDVEQLVTLCEEMQRGDVDSLLILGGNPALTSPADIPFADLLTKVRHSWTFAMTANDTTERSDWVIPRSHFLESWGDARGHDGTASIVQPMITPLYDSFSDVEVLANLTEDAPSAYHAVRKTWRDQLGEEEADDRWQTALAEGVIAEESSEDNGLASTLVASMRQRITSSSENVEENRTKGQFDIVLRPDPTIWDGRFINNGWLQELPKPLTHTVWDNVAFIAPSDAAKNGLANRDLVRIGSDEHAIEIPVWIVPGQAKGCLSVFFGYGQAPAGRVGAKTGFNVQPLRKREGMWHQSEVPVARTGKQSDVVTTQHFQVMEGRHLARAGTLSAYLKQQDHPEFAHPTHPAPDVTLYPEWENKGHKWGMSIDLTACVGCSACVVACQAENNIPVVGKKQCDMNRHMHWIRIDTYYKGEEDEPAQTLHQPVPCMHCEHAPCEIVCPVAATTHSEEGLNQMVYNRCVGTRYCSNNCPYKVRRFNFLSYAEGFLSEPSLHLLSNPEVTVRSRGVMEKCTYCVQRIENAKIAAQVDGRSLGEGDVITACQGACPAEAIVFGDLFQADSAVKQAHEHPLSYQLLEELSVRPRTTYLAEVKNPHEEHES